MRTIPQIVPNNLLGVSFPIQTRQKIYVIVVTRYPPWLVRRLNADSPECLLYPISISWPTTLLKPLHGITLNPLNFKVLCRWNQTFYCRAVCLALSLGSVLSTKTLNGAYASAGDLICQCLFMIFSSVVNFKQRNFDFKCWVRIFYCRFVPDGCVLGSCTRSHW